jgi:AcrR family transcriptional regulator
VTVARPARRPRHLAQTRADILEATEQVVAEFGYAGSRIEEICSRAGVSRGAFYHHFASKEAAIVALLERGVVRLVERMQELEGLAGDDPARMVALGIAVILRFVEAEGPVSRAYFIDMLGVPEAQGLRERIDLGFEARMRLNLEPLFASGQLDSSNPRATVRAVMGMAKETAVAWMQNRVADIDSALREVVRMALAGVGVDAKRAAELADEAVAYRVLE